MTAACPCLRLQMGRWPYPLHDKTQDFWSVSSLAVMRSSIYSNTHGLRQRTSSGCGTNRPALPKLAMPQDVGSLPRAQRTRARKEGPVRSADGLAAMMQGFACFAFSRQNNCAEGLTWAGARPSTRFFAWLPSTGRASGRARGAQVPARAQCQSPPFLHPSM